MVAGEPTSCLNKNDDKLKTELKILHLEDTPTDAELVERELKKGKIQCEILVVGNKTAFEKALEEFKPDIILSDHSLPSFDSLQAIKIMKQKGMKIPIVLVTSTVSDEYAVEVMKAGADDYILKDRLPRLPQAVMNAMEKNKAVLELQLAQEKIVYTNRLYSFISHVNQTIVHVTDEQQVFKEVCSIAIEFGKFKAAWIGIIDMVNQKINLEEGNGILPEYLAKFKNVSYQDHGPQYHVLQTNSYYICNNIQKDLELKDWKLFAAENGFNALLVLPIRKSGNIIGTFNLYAAEINFFNAAEIALLTEAADDISFALDVFEKDKLRATAESNLQTIFENTSEGFILFDTNRIVKSFNTKFAQTILLNTEQKIKIGGHLYDYIHPSRKEGYESNISKVLAGENIQYNRFFERKNGDIKWFSFTINPAYNKAGVIEGFCIKSADITEAKQAEEALQKSESNLQTIFENTSEGFILTDLNGIIKVFNQNANNNTLLNSGQEITIGSNIFDYIQPSRKENYKLSVSKVLLGETIKYDHYYERKNGEIKWFNFAITPAHNAGNITGVCITSADITEQKNAEQLLRESESFNKGVLSSLSSHIAVIDDIGNIIAVNKVWDDFAKANGVNSLQEVSVGSNYIEVCQRAMASGDSIAGQTLAGIQSVFKEEKKNFEMEYPCHSPEQQRWFILSVKHFGSDAHKVVISHQDISERKIAENNLSNTSVVLQKTLSDLNKILDSSLDVICTINANGEFTKVSAASQLVWGYTPEELINTKFINLVYHEDVDKTLKTAEQIVSRIQVPTFENRYVHKSGRIVPILWSINWDEKLQLLFCIAKDVTEKKRLEKAVETERDQFFEMFSRAPSAIGRLKGPNHVFEMVNPLYLQLIGKKDVIGKTVAEMLPEIIEQGFIGLLDNVYATGKSYIGKEALIKFDKEGNGELTDAYLNFIYQAYRNEAGNIEGIFFFANDITEQILARKAIEKSEKFFKGVIESSADMIALVDPAGNTIYASPAVSKVSGYSFEECLEINIADIVHADDALIMQEFLIKIMMLPGVPMESPLVRLRKKDGSYIWVEGTLTNFYETEGINAIIANFRDVTVRKLTAEANKFKANLLNTIGQAAIATDINGVVNYWNKAAENIYGWTKDEALGKNIMDLTTSETSNEQAIQIMEELKKGQTWAGEFKVRKKDGTNFPVHITNSPIHDENNILSGIIGISTDITEKKKLEDLLEKTNRLAAIGSWEIDVVKGTVFWSDITKEIREADKDYVPLLEVGISQFKEGIDKETINQRLQECIEHGTPWDEELQIITFKGNHKWIRTIGEGTFLNGKCIRMHGSFQDISVRKQVEQSLRQSKSNLQAILENTDATIYSLDREFRYIAFNASLYDNLKKLYGLDIKIGDHVFNFLEKLEPEEAIGWEEIYSKAFKGKTIKFEKEFYIGEFQNYSSFSIYPIWENETIIGLSCFINNITEQKLEQKQKDKMSADILQKNRDLEQFTFIISHNLRAPTANIIGYAEILQDKTLTQEEEKELLQGLSKSATALDSVIKDINGILQVKREINDKKEVILFSTLVSDIKTSISNLIEKHHVVILSDFSEVDEIYSLKIYIYSIFYNLIINSIKYRKPNDAPCIEIKSKLQEGKIMLTFKDNGLGIDLKTKGNKIFGLYARFHSHVDGKGMGLYMVKTQIESLGGKITIDSEPDKGTQFTIIFENKI